MTEIPRLRIELEGIKATVAHMFAQNQDALLEMISETLERTLNQEWIQEEINREVENCIRKAIADVSNNYNLRSAITNMVADQVDKLLSEREA